MDAAAQQKLKAPAAKDAVIYAFLVTALQRPNCLLDLASATAETSALPAGTCVVQIMHLLCPELQLLLLSSDLAGVPQAIAPSH